MRLFSRFLKLLIVLLLFMSANTFSEEVGITEKTLQNGMKIVYKKIPLAKRVTARIVVPVGFLHEPKELLGISHLIEHLVFRGNNNHSLSDFPGLMDDTGNIYNGLTTLNRTEYFLNTTSENLLPVFSSFLDLILHPAFAEVDIEKEKKIVTVEEVLRTIPGNVFVTYLNHLTQNQFDSMIESIKAAEIIDFHNRYYTVDQITVIITGNFNVTEFTEYLASLPKTNKKTKENTHTSRINNTLPIYKNIQEEIILNDYLPGAEYRLLFGINLEELKGKDLAIAKILPFILQYESRQYDYFNNRPLDYMINLFGIGDKFYLIFIYNDYKEKFTPKINEWHDKNLKRYCKYLKAKDFDKFLSEISSFLDKHFDVIKESSSSLNEFYTGLLFEPTTISRTDLKYIKKLSTKDLKKFVHTYLENKKYNKIVIKAL